MKTRIVQTDFYMNMTKLKAPKDVRILYKYLFDNQYINMCGIYELADDYILLDTGLTLEEFEKAKEWLIEKKKVYFHDGWVYVIKAEKYNQYKKSPKNLPTYQRELASIPADIREHFNITMDSSFEKTVSSIDSSIDTTHKPKNGNKKSKTKTFEESRETLTENFPKKVGIMAKLPDLKISEDQKGYLVSEILSRLKDGQSEKFYRLVVSKIPEQKIWETLSELKASSGSSPPRIFSYKMQRIALEMLNTKEAKTA